METFIKGNFRKAIFQNEKGYMVGLFKVRDTNIETLKDYINKTITFTGTFYDLNEDDTYFFYGEEENHPRYGMQFRVVEYERIKPEDKDGIVEFLSSNLFPGVGEKLALTIVEALGEQTLDRILEDPSCLSLVPKLTTKKAKKIHQILSQYEESHKTIVYLTELGFNMKDALNIYNKYRGNTIPTLECRFYHMIDEVDDLSFLKLDEISKKLNRNELEPDRIEACILYFMDQLISSSGDTYLCADEIKKKVRSYLNFEIEEEQFTEYFESLVDKEKIVIENGCYYLTMFYEAEMYVIDRISYLSSKAPIKNTKLDVLLSQLETENNIEYNEKQKEAIKSAMEENILIITGGPGTGKTTIIKAIVSMYQKIHHLSYDQLVADIALLAPTGRASKRMSESTSLPAMTIHRFLKYNQELNEFGINEQNKDNSKLFIIDEVSMIDLMLLNHLLKGIYTDIQILLVGDYNQLPSVGPGQVLKDLIESHTIKTIALDLLYRQKEDSYITTLAHEIKDDELSETFLETKSDYTFLQCNSASIKMNLKTLCTQVVDKGYDYKRVQLMAPMYRGENGIDALNHELQDVFNPPSSDKKELIYGEVIFREHDKILQLVNMPDENIFNGDLGVIQEIILAPKSQSGKNEIYVNYDGIVVKYLPKDFIKMKHGFVISIHKSQGSEFEMVIMPISKSYYRMLYRKLIYTGITRAKKKLILLGEPNLFVQSIHNNNEYVRKTNLLLKLQNIMYQMLKN